MALYEEVLAINANMSEALIGIARIPSGENPERTEQAWKEFWR